MRYLTSIGMSWRSWKSVIFLEQVKDKVRDFGVQMTGKPFPTKVFDSTYDELTYKCKYRWEMHVCRKTTVLQNEGKVPEFFCLIRCAVTFPKVSCNQGRVRNINPDL